MNLSGELKSYSCTRWQQIYFSWIANILHIILLHFLFFFFSFFIFFIFYIGLYFYIILSYVVMTFPYKIKFYFLTINQCVYDHYNTPTGPEEPFKEPLKVSTQRCVLMFASPIIWTWTLQTSCIYSKLTLGKIELVF